MSMIETIAATPGARPGSGGRVSPGKPAADAGVSGLAGGFDDIAMMLFKLEQEAIGYKVALRVQEVGMRSQPLSRVDLTDLALMIASGNTMGRVLEAVQSQSAFGAPMPPGYAEGW